MNCLSGVAFSPNRCRSRQQKRQSGDYDIDFDIDSDEQELLIKKAQEFVSNIMIYLQGLDSESKES